MVSKRLVDNQELLGMYEYETEPFTFKEMGHRALARRSDPETSKAGAVHAIKTLAQAAERALQGVSRHPGLTCAEMEHADGVRERTYGRRLKDLEQDGKVRRLDSRTCGVSGRLAATWRAT